jgi:hypothetical protein
MDFWLDAIRKRRQELVDKAQVNLDAVRNRYAKASGWTRFWNEGAFDHCWDIGLAEKELQTAKNFYRGLELAIECNHRGVIEIDDNDTIAILG